MAVRIGINGFGRVGRLAVRALRSHSALELVHVNEHRGGPETAAHLLEFDSVHGRYEGDVRAEAAGLVVDGRPVTFSEHSSPAEIDWAGFGVEIVIESTGAFKTRRDLIAHLDRGASSVVVACPVKDAEVLNVVMGCNDQSYDPSTHAIVTAASCTTNCLAPIVKVLHESIGIEQGAITTIHDATNTQAIVDSPHKDLRRARSALNSLIPTTTGSATAISLIYPELAGRLSGLAVRVPLLNASLTDCVFSMRRSTSVEEVNGLLAAAAGAELLGILGFEHRPLVSADFTSDTRSAIVDGPSTTVIGGSLVKVLAWYDNEYGYAHRLVDLVRLVASGLGGRG
jgi:glyceraldehyde 3-phosphate dehydrogenase